MEVVSRFQEFENRLRILNQFKSLRAARVREKISSKILILVYSDPKADLEILSFDTMPVATKKLFELERQYGDTKDIVLVRGLSEESIRQAYRNYFSNTQDFVKLIEKGVMLLSGV